MELKGRNDISMQLLDGDMRLEVLVAARLVPSSDLVLVSHILSFSP